MLLLVAACGTPQEQCIRSGTRDLQVLDRLIQESRATISRGYAIEEIETTRMVWAICGPPAIVDGKPVGPPRRCWEQVPEITRRPKAVDLSVERATLRSMEAKRVELSRAAAPVIAACQAKYPQ